jgi:hypothetical protein
MRQDTVGSLLLGGFAEYRMLADGRVAGDPLDLLLEPAGSAVCAISRRSLAQSP